jgi:hypothetical protein
VLWQTNDPGVIEHDHPELSEDDPHLQGAVATHRHAHVFVIDDHHRSWPTA